ncbi:MAG: hypothetical protein V7K50_03505 [Nostoc sp.]|uniref:hypothetical protein n=1 Tax=Nostoc sp. TaxID=1180 RepID=UPI002FFC3123
MMGAKKANKSDRFPQRLEMAKKFAKAEVINSEKLGKMPTPQAEVNPGEALKEMTGGCSIDAVSLKGYHIFQQQRITASKLFLNPEW